MHQAPQELKNKTLMVVGPINDQIDKLAAIDKLYNNKTVLVFLGDLCYPFDDIESTIKRIELFRNFIKNKDCFYILGDKDLIFMKKIFNTYHDTYQWLYTQPKLLKFLFPNNTSVTLLHGGILPKYKSLHDINSDLESVFINGHASNNNWHLNYKGNFGFILSSHPDNINSTIKIYKHSASLDTCCWKTKVLALQEFSKDGLGKTLYI